MVKPKMEQGMVNLRSWEQEYRKTADSKDS